MLASQVESLRASGQEKDEQVRGPIADCDGHQNSMRAHSTLAWPCTHELAGSEVDTACVSRCCVQVDEACRKMSEFEKLVVELKAMHQSGPCVTRCPGCVCLRARPHFMCAHVSNVRDLCLCVCVLEMCGGFAPIRHGLHRRPRPIVRRSSQACSGCAARTRTRLTRISLSSKTFRKLTEIECATACVAGLVPFSH